MLSKNSRKWKNLLIILLMGIIIGCNLIVKDCSLVKPELKFQNISYSSNIPKIKYLELQNHSIIRISNNSDFHNQAAVEGWDLGGTRDGSSLKPYEISGYIIRNNSSYLFSINNTDVHFIFRDNILTNTSNKDGPGEGIVCINVTNAVFENNFIQGIGIYIPYWNPISTSNSFTNYINNKNYCFVKKIFDAEWFSGIRCEDSHTMIKNNIISGFSVSIQLDNCSNNQIQNNSLSHNIFSIDFHGNSNNNLCINNSISYSHQSVMIGGIPGSKNNTIISNSITWSHSAITVGGGPENTISNNTISNCEIGIILFSACRNSFSGNKISDSITAFVCYDYSCLNSFSNNTIKNCVNGFTIKNSQYNLFINNILYNQTGYAIHLWYDEGYPPIPPTEESKSTYKNNITKNIFYNNSRGDISLENYTTKNFIFMNKFLRTTSTQPRITDNGTCNYILFNYYISWSGLDNNADNCIDQPYLIPGLANNFDPFPLTDPNVYIDLSEFSDLYICRNISLITYTTPTTYTTILSSSTHQTTSQETPSSQINPFMDIYILFFFSILFYFNKKRE